MEKKIGKNVSSGAEKVENVQEQIQAENARSSAKKTAKKSSPKSTKKNAVNKAVKKEEAAAQKRVNAAKERASKKEKKLIAKAELKQKKMEKKAALKTKKIEKRAAQAKAREERKQKKLERIAAQKERKAELRAEKEARREMLKHESKAEKQKRIEREKKEHAALRRQKQEAKHNARENKRKAREAAHARKADDKKHKREQKTERKKRTAGFGGWLAAVISLGTACLALATVVTAGAIRMNDMDTDMANGYRSTLFEMVSVSEDMDNNLSKLRVSSGANEQRKLLEEILVDSALMESALERIPVDSATSTDISSFVNKTGSYARTLLTKIAAGKQLTQTEKNTVEYLYNVNSKLYNELNELATHMSESDFRAFLKGSEGNVSGKFQEMGQGTLAQPEDTVDAPFSGEGNVGRHMLENLEEVSVSRAEEIAREYFDGYHVRDVRFGGETVARETECYNFVLTDENDIEIFAQITKRGGKLVFFDTYETCTQKNFDLESCDSIARKFLKEIGIDNVEAVWLSDAGMVADITYVGVQNGVRVYPDMIKVRVCESKGRVIGIEAVGYLANNKERSAKASLSKAEAQKRLSSSLEVKHAQLAIVPVDEKEVLAYEFDCVYGDQQYIVYLDANSGEEVQVYRVRNSSSGSYLR